MAHKEQKYMTVRGLKTCKELASDICVTPNTARKYLRNNPDRVYDPEYHKEIKNNQRKMNPNLIIDGELVSQVRAREYLNITQWTLRQYLEINPKEVMNKKYWKDNYARLQEARRIKAKRKTKISSTGFFSPKNNATDNYLYNNKFIGEL